MKKSILPLSLALLAFVSCSPDTTDGANDAAGSASPVLARQVTGVRMLSKDSDYGAACNYLAEQYVRSTFKLGATDELQQEDGPRGCSFNWEGNEVTISFDSERPYPSVYHAEYIFNKNYQPGVEKPMQDTPMKPALTGPDPEGTGAETPASSATGMMAKRDTSAANDTATTVSGVTAAAARLTPLPVTAGRFQAYPGLGDKAVWEPSKQTMHVLLNNHILNVQVKTKGKPAQAPMQAAMLANVVFDDLIGEHLSR